MRVTDYSTSGTVDTWKVGLQWAVTDWIKFRGVVSRDIRAPTLFDLFAGDQSAIGTLFDPVTGQQQNVPQIIGGNPLLEPEEADTESFGVVFEPSFAPGLALSVDYWKIEINDAIGTLTSQQIVNNCFESGGTAPECDLITRPAPDQFPTSIRQAPANVAFIKTSGIDIDARYGFSAGPGDLSLRLFATYLDSYKTQQFEGAPVLDFQGVATATSNPEGRPEWRGMLNVNYEVGQFGIFLSEQYIGDMEVDIPGAPNEFADHSSVGSTFYTDVTVTYRPDALQGVEFFATVNNLFDEEPPILPGTIPGVNLPTVYSVYDTIGMAFSLGARARF
jgi:outer membrane receptor protein involved in Fe transport